MGIIGNHFITIEYNSKDEKTLAIHFMHIFNSDPNYYQGILNGLSTINAKELPSPSFNKLDRIHLINYILEKNNANYICFSDVIPSVNDVYLALMKWFYHDPQDLEAQYIYYQLAYDYLIRTGENEYLKKHFYSDEFERSDISYLCAYEIRDCYEELLHEKIKSFQSSHLYTEIMSNIDTIYRVIDFTTNQRNRNQNKSVKIPKLSKRRFEERVIGALTYIDPTNKLLEEYLEFKKEGKVNLIYGEPKGISGYIEIENRFTREIVDRYINIYMKRNLYDVKCLIHELGHYFYRNTEETADNDNRLLVEYPSIYFEKKALEYLVKVGYSEAIIEEIENERKKDNKKTLDRFLPSLYCIECNTDIGEYHIEEVKKFANGHKVKPPDTRIEKYMLDKDKRSVKKDHFRCLVGTLNTVDDDTTNLKYLIGSYLATYSINNLPHEEVLRILEYIRHPDSNLAKMVELVGINKQDTTYSVKQKTYK